MYLIFNEIIIVVQKSALKMERLIVFLALLAMSSGCTTTVTKDFVFGCPAPNNEGLQAVFEEFSKLPREEMEAYLNSSSMRRIGVLFLNYFDPIVSSPEYQKLRQFVCDKVFLDSTTYQEIFWVCLVYTFFAPAPEIPDSELREDFLNLTSKLYQTEFYRKTQEILYKHIPADPYAQLGMEYLNSADMKQILKDVLSIPELKSEVDKLTSLGFPMIEALEVLGYASASAWSRE